MSEATKKKYVAKEVLEDFVLPSDKCYIVQVVAGKGNNLHEVENDAGDRFLVSMPTKFRKSIWIKRGDFVMVEPIEEGDKVRAEIVHILYKQQIQYIKKQGLWPQRFASGESSADDGAIPSDLLPPSESDSDSDAERTDIVNPNRVCRTNVVDHASDTDSDEEVPKT